MSGSTATPASTAAASAGRAEAYNSRFDGKNRVFFGFDPIITKQSIANTIGCGRIPVSANREFSRPEPGTDHRNRELTGNLPGSESVPPLPRENRHSVRQLCGRIADTPRRFRLRAKQLVFFIARLPIAA
jgi:hypothetical protein